MRFGFISSYICDVMYEYNTYTNKYKSTTEQVPVCPSALLLVMSTYAEESH